MHWIIPLLRLRHPESRRPIQKMFITAFSGFPLMQSKCAGALRRIEVAADARNVVARIDRQHVNFLAAAHSNVQFRQSILISDLCPVDGMPVVWLARALGVPIKGRVAGSDIFEALKKERETLRPLKVFLFGPEMKEWPQLPPLP